MSKGNRKRRKALGLLPDRERCVARNRFGEPCKNYPIDGGFVCRAHGGSAPQVRAKAQERLALAMDDAASLLIRFAHDPDLPANVRLAAVKDILDRGGIGTKKELEVVLKRWEEDIDGVFFGEDEDVVEAELVEDEPKAIPPSNWEYRTEVLTEKDSEPSLVRGNRKRGR